ncbi:MAG: OmpA family protein [Bacteroidetes bacterium]|jgi:chemotaxis protein MotB|nr:OmpA family protein [Bacteroidota bacterium]
MKNKIVLTGLVLTILMSCVSKKKYVELENNYENTRSELQATRMERDNLQSKMEEIQMRVQRYNNKIASLNQEKEGMMVNVSDDNIVLSEKNKQAMRKTLAGLPESKLAGATTLKDSLNIAIAHNVSKNMSNSEEDLNMSIAETYVKINIDDNLLFKDSSYRVGSDADDILAKIAEVAKSEPSLEVMVEGHTDSRTMKKDSYIIDNWDLSARRSAAIVRRLQDKFGVSPDQLIVAGRSSYDPVAPNDTKENMAKNRRTQIVIMPNLDKFFALLGEEE